MRYLVKADGLGVTEHVGNAKNEPRNAALWQSDDLVRAFNDQLVITQDAKLRMMALAIGCIKPIYHFLRYWRASVH